MFSRVISPRLAEIARLEQFAWQKATPPCRVPRASRQGAPGRRATLSFLCPLSRFDAFSKETYKKLALLG